MDARQTVIRDHDAGWRQSTQKKSRMLGAYTYIHTRFTFEHKYKSAEKTTTAATELDPGRDTARKYPNSEPTPGPITVMTQQQRDIPHKKDPKTPVTTPTTTIINTNKYRIPTTPIKDPEKEKNGKEAPRTVIPDPDTDAEELGLGGSDPTGGKLIEVVDLRTLRPIEGVDLSTDNEGDSDG